MFPGEEKNFKTAFTTFRDKISSIVKVQSESR